MAWWLFKSEPHVFSIDDLKAKGKVDWDGVRNYTARNFLRDRVAVGDTVFFYHSSCPEPGIAGLATVTRAGYPDPTAFRRNDKYFDPKSDPAAPRWYCVEVGFKAKASGPIPLAWMREDPVASGMELFRLNRLSVTPVSPAQAQRLLSLPVWKGGRPGAGKGRP